MPLERAIGDVPRKKPLERERELLETTLRGKREGEKREDREQGRMKRGERKERRGEIGEKRGGERKKREREDQTEE